MEEVNQISTLTNVGNAHTEQQPLRTSIPINVGILDTENRMRIGKLQEQVLKVMYDFEREPITFRDDFPYIIKWGGRHLKLLTAREIVEKITKLKYPKEKDYGVNNLYRFKWMVSGDKEKGEVLDKIRKGQDKWHHSTKSIYRAIRLLEKQGLIMKLESDLRHNERNYLVLRERGRRIISHRIKKLPPKNKNLSPIKNHKIKEIKNHVFI